MGTLLVFFFFSFLLHLEFFFKEKLSLSPVYVFTYSSIYIHLESEVLILFYFFNSVVFNPVLSLFILLLKPFQFCLLGIVSCWSPLQFLTGPHGFNEHFLTFWHKRFQELCLFSGELWF